MVAQPGERKRSHNAGEISPLLSEAVDVKQYYAGGLKYRNVEPVAQSGFRQMAGSRDLGPVRGRLAALETSGASAAPGPHTGTATVWSATVAGALAVLHVAALSAEAEDAAHVVTAEVLTGSGWVAIGAAQTILPGEARPLTFALAPGTAPAATAARLRCAFSTGDTLSIGTVLAFAESDIQDTPRLTELRHDTGDRYRLALTAGLVDIWQDDTWRAALRLPAVTDVLLPEVEFYAENATVGIFARGLRTVRLRRAGAATAWTVDDWPYRGVPKVDYGGVYPTTDDVWEIQLTWAEDGYVYLGLTVDGETTPAIPLADSGGTPQLIGAAQSDGTLWTQYAQDLQDALQALPSLGAGVTVATEATAGNFRKFTVTFADALAGREFQLSALATNTTNVAAVAYHVGIGETEFEPLLSASRGWPGNVCLVQDRLAYLDIAGQPPAIALSQAAEYFDLSIRASGASAARLDRLRAGATNERVLAGIDATYFVVFTERAVYFASNRVISATDPINYTLAAQTGIVAGTRPLAAAGKLYYVARNVDEDGEETGHQMVSLRYDEIATNFVAAPESLLASHLVDRVVRAAHQRSDTGSDADRLWLLRADGRLVCGLTIPSQEILGFCEWVAADGGMVRAITVDARNQCWIVVERGGEKRFEAMDRSLFLQGAVYRSADFAGVVTGLSRLDGRTVWAVADGWVLGPFTVVDGAIDLGDYYPGVVTVGLWQPPVYETMPRWRILPDDTILKRPGRIFAVAADVVDTTSIAFAANGEPPRAVSLVDTGTPTNAPPPARTGTVERFGMMGLRTGTTLTITQTRPGRLQVRTHTIQEKL